MELPHFWTVIPPIPLTALCLGTNTRCFPSCSTAEPSKLCYISQELLLLFWKRPSLCLLCCHITCSHTEDCSVTTAVWLPSIYIIYRTWFQQQNQGWDFRGSASTLGRGFPKDWALQGAAKYRPTLHSRASMVVFIHNESWGLWKIWSHIW